MGSSLQPTFDPALFRVAAKQNGYSDDEIDRYIQERAPDKVPFFSKLLQDSNRQEELFKKGLYSSLANTAGSVARIGQMAEAAPSSLSGPVAGLGRLAGKAQEFIQKRIPTVEAPAGQGKLDRFADKASEVMGTIAGEVPVSMLISKPIRAGAEALALGTSSTLAKSILTGSVPGSYFKTVAASIPLEMAESVITDAIVHPEDIASKEGLARSALLGAASSLVGAKSRSILGPQLGPKQADPLGELLAGPPARTSNKLSAVVDQELFDPARSFKDMGDWKAPDSQYSLARRLAGVEDQIHLNMNEVRMVPQKGGGYVRSDAPTYRQLVNNVTSGSSGEGRLQALADWDKYLLGKSGYDLAADAADVQKQIKQIEAQYPHFADLAVEYKRYTDDLVDTMHGYGMIDDDIAKEWKSGSMYVPTGRQFSNPLASTNHMKAKTNTASIRQIKSPMQQLFEMERNIITRGESNKLGQGILQELNIDPGKWKGRLEIATPDFSPVERTMKELEESYKQSNLPVPPLKVLRAQAELVSDEVLDGTTGKLRVMQNGVPVDIRVSDPMVLEFYKARKYVEPSTVGNIARGVERFTTQSVFQPMRELTGKNAALDQIEAFLNTKWNEYVPGYDFAKGVWAQVKKDPRIQDLRAERGIIATRYADANMFENASKYTDFLKQAEKESGVKTVFMNPLAAMHELMGVLSQGTRIGAGLRKMEQTGSAALGADMARNVLADPQQRGVAQSIKLLSNSSFANYSLQSTRRLMQAAADNPSTFATKGLMTITLPSVGFWLLGKGDQEIQDLRKSKGGNGFWFVRNPQTKEIYSIQKPYTQGQMFGTAVETALDGMKEDDAVNFAKSLVESITPSPVPITAQLAAESVFGKNFFGIFDGTIPLQPASMEGALPEDVAGNNTLQISKEIASTSGIDASKVDNFIKTILFSQATDVADRLDRKIFNRTAPETKAGWEVLLPTVKKVNPNRSNVEPLNRFYDKFAEIAKVGKSFDLAASQGNGQRLQALQAQYPKEFARWQAYDAMNEVLGVINQQINITNSNNNLSPEDRRERITNLRKMAISKAREWNALFDGLDENKKQ